MTARTDPFTRFCLLAILTLLAVIAARPLLHSSSARADTAPQYKTEIVEQGTGGKSEAAAQQVIQERTREGWQLVAATVYHRELSNAVGPVYLLVFRK